MQSCDITGNDCAKYSWPGDVNNWPRSGWCYPYSGAWAVASWWCGRIAVYRTRMQTKRRQKVSLYSMNYFTILDDFLLVLKYSKESNTIIWYLYNSRLWHFTIFIVLVTWSLMVPWPRWSVLVCTAPTTTSIWPVQANTKKGSSGRFMT